MSKTQDGLTYRCKTCLSLHYKENIEKYKKKQVERYKIFKDEINAKRKLEDSYAKKTDKVSHYHYNALYRARKLSATPPWLDEKMLSEIKEVYRECQELSEETGVPHHVDHIVPLKGKNVRGLHVPWNLRAIPAEENLTKGNKFI